MGQGVHIGRQMVRETLLALLVLAIVFLNFGHQNLAFAGDGHIVSAASAFCGDPIHPNDAGHAPCHACRIGAGADLPPAPCAVEPASFVATASVYATMAVDAEVAPFRLAASPRAPPAA
jgi:hypothetical protein